MWIFENADYKFLEHRRKGYMVSAAVLLAGIIAMFGWALAGRGWVYYGLDFTGGTMVQVEFAEVPNVGDIRSALAELGPEVTRFGADNEYLIRVAEFTEEGTEVSVIINAMLEDAFGEGAFQVIRTEAVGPTIGEELQRKALLAILLSFGLTLVYLAFRFEWRFGVAAIIATVHDILITLGFISIFRLEVSLPTVAAVLTIIGYSLNDTIVVFDRVRENRKNIGRRQSPIEIINRSINEVLPRTAVTSATTFIVLLVLFLLGGAIIRDFAMILMLGVIIGTYSSIFVASPALVEIEERTSEGKKQPSRSRAAAL